GSSTGDASLGQFPILANAVLQWPNASHWTPYLGGGCGLVVSEMYLHHTTIQGTALHGDAATATFGYQGFAGARYQLDPRWNVSLGYAFLGTTRPSWDVTGPGSNQTIGSLALSHPYSHSFMAGFVLRF